MLRRANGIGGTSLRTVVASGTAGDEARGLFARNAAAPQSDAALFLHGNRKYTKRGKKKYRRSINKQLRRKKQLRTDSCSDPLNIIFQARNTAARASMMRIARTVIDSPPGGIFNNCLRQLLARRNC